MPLTDTLLRNLKSTGKTFKTSDSLGLYIEISPAGGKWWRWKYRYAGKEKRLSFGVYPEITLKQAREDRDRARQLLARGTDPGAERKRTKLVTLQKDADSFEAIGREWMGKQSPNWSGTHAESNTQRLRDYIYPLLGSRPIADITAPELLAVIRRVESRSVEVAHRTLRVVGQIFRYGIATGRCERNPTADLKGALPAYSNGHFAATLDSKSLGRMLRAMDLYEGSPQVVAALKLAPLLFVRPGELRRAEWKDFDLDAAEWRYAVTKTAVDHIVPLSVQALSIIRELHPHTKNGIYLFPSARGGGRPMSENAVLLALRSLGISKEEMSGHGFRAVARTLLDEELHFPPHIIEHQLAHSVRDPLGRAYNRTSHLPERRKMMQAWADHLDALKRRSELAVMRA